MKGKQHKKLEVRHLMAKVEFSCDMCGKNCFKKKNLTYKNKFCSRTCYWKYRKENKMWPPSRKGVTLSREHVNKMIIGIKKTYLEHPEKRRFGRIVWNKGKKLLHMRGENACHWKGGHVRHPDKRIRKSIEYKEWRTAVFKRDDYTCQMCKRRGCQIQADHIKPFASHSDLRLNVENGRTLCVVCHKKTDTYGKRLPVIK